MRAKWHSSLNFIITITLKRSFQEHHFAGEENEAGQ